jgi:hypothetical protein
VATAQAELNVPMVSNAEGSENPSGLRRGIASVPAGS